LKDINNNRIRKIYIEPTSRCNLDCEMCPRNSWTDEQLGDMDMNLYQILINQMKQLNNLETITFGGVAEPVTHNNIVQMVELAKSLDVRVEMTTNGNMLNYETMEQLLRAGIDRIWFSIDSGHTDSYFKTQKFDSDKQNKSIANLWTFNVLRQKINPHAEFGIAFVAMKSNIHELPDVIRLGKQTGACEIKISNIIPYSKEMQKEMLYGKSLSFAGFKEDFIGYKSMKINMPVMDFEGVDKEVITSVLSSGDSVMLGENLVVRKSGSCRFIRDRSIFVKWDGEVSPCIALLHNNTTYLHDVERKIRSCSFGNIKKTSINQIWESTAYINFRNRVEEFSFAPCTTCGSCNFFESNEEDCTGNTFPTCGGCLWAEGFSQCP
jgi:MoaA/NifB/PqqE/SkfB family radical SAM enzyme